MSWQRFLEIEALSDIGISIGILLLFLLFRKIFTKYIFKLLLRLSKKARTEFISHVFLSFEKPVQWLFIIIGINVAAKYFPYFNEDMALFRSLVRASLIFLVSWGLFNLSSVSSLVLTRVNKKYNMEIDRILIPFLSKAIRIVIVVISFSIIIEEFGYKVSGLVAGLGIGGLAVSLAAKDALANLFGGIVIITEKPFSIGDWIKTPSVEGVVEDISFRSTKVRTFAQALVIVPNATLANENITNWTKMGKRRISFDLEVDYDTSKEKLKLAVERIDNMLRNHPDIHQETILVSFDKFSTNGFSIFLYFFTKSTVWAEHLRVKQDTFFKIMDILESLEVKMALPSTKMYFAESGRSQEKEHILMNKQTDA